MNHNSALGKIKKPSMQAYVSQFLLCLFHTVCSLQRLHGPDRQPRVKHGTARQRRASGDPRPVHLLHEKSGDQTQPGAASLHTSWTHAPPHTDLKPLALRTDSTQRPLRVHRELSTSCFCFGWKQETRHRGKGC